MMFESWDEDPEARLTAANIVSRLDIMLQETQPRAVGGVEQERDSDDDSKDDTVVHREMIVSLSENSQAVEET